MDIAARVDPRLLSFDDEIVDECHCDWMPTSTALVSKAVTLAVSVMTGEAYETSDGFTLVQTSKRLTRA